MNGRSTILLWRLARDANLVDSIIDGGKYKGVGFQRESTDKANKHPKFFSQTLT